MHYIGIGALVAILVLALIFAPRCGCGGPGLDGDGSAGRTNNTSVNRDSNDSDDTFVVIIRDDRFYHDGREESLENLVDDAREWYEDNERPITIMQEHGTVGAEYELKQSLDRRNIQYTD